jgi:hypothetical protein
MLRGIAPVKYGLSLMYNWTKLVRLPIPAGIVPYRLLLDRRRFFSWGKAEKSNLSSVPFRLVPSSLRSVICPAGSQLMCVQLQRLVELANDHDPRDSSGLAKLAFQFTSASASREMPALSGAAADSWRQVQESRKRPTELRCFMMA